MIQTDSKILIIGAGLTGSLLAIFMARRGFSIEIYEKRNDPRGAEQTESKRTIAMSLSHRGLLALEKAGIKDIIERSATPTYGRVSHNCEGETSKQKYSVDGNSILTIDRNNLNIALLDQLNLYKNVTIFFNHSLEKIDFEQKNCEIMFNRVLKILKYDYLLGADGVFSVCRSEYEKFLNISSQIEKIPISYKEMQIPFSNLTNDWEKSFVHVWPSQTQEAIFVALPSKTKEAFLVNIFCPNEWVDYFVKDPTGKEISRYLSIKFPSLSSVLNKIKVKHLMGTASNMYQVKSGSWNYKSSFLLLGDAIHAIPPFYAMGMNLSFESCYIFDNLINHFQGNISQAILEFQNERKIDTDAMQELAYSNFDSLLSSTCSSYREIWAIERKIGSVLPDYWKSEYEWIAFTDVRLSEVKKKILKQKRLIRDLTMDNNLLKKYWEKETIYLAS